MTLTDEQRAGLARFLGVAGYKKLEGGWEWFPDHPSSVATYVEFTDDKRADLMLALLERAAEQNYYVRIGPNHAPDYPGDFTLRDWSASICELPFDLEREVTFYGATPLEAMVEAVLQLPEAQPEHRQE